MNKLELTTEMEFHKAKTLAVLQDMHARQQWDDLLSYASLLAEMEVMYKVQVQWLVREAADNLARR